MRRLLAIALVVLGIAGLVLGRLGETVWAPETERTATVALKDAGPAVLVDPGIVYAGGHEGTVTIKAASDVHVISTDKADATAYLGGARYTEVNGVPNWSTLTARTVQPQGEKTLPDPSSADLWSSVATAKSPATIPVSQLWKGDGGASPARPYRALLIVTDGTKPAATSVSVTWPVEASNAWVPYAYAIGAALAVLGLILFAIDFAAASARRRRARDEQEADHDHAAARRSGRESGAEGATTTSRATGTGAPTGATAAGAATATSARGRRTTEDREAATTRIAPTGTQSIPVVPDAEDDPSPRRERRFRPTKDASTSDRTVASDSARESRRGSSGSRRAAPERTKRRKDKRR